MINQCNIKVSMCVLKHEQCYEKVSMCLLKHEQCD